MAETLEEVSLAAIETAALKLLLRREHTRFELQHKLQHQSFAVAAIVVALQSLEARGLQSDERFTEAYTHMRVGRGYGPVRIANELRERRVSDDLIMEYLEKYSEYWQEGIVAVRQKRFGTALPKEAALRAKQMRFLLYRGFTAEQINKLFRSYK